MSLRVATAADMIGLVGTVQIGGGDEGLRLATDDADGRAPDHVVAHLRSGGLSATRQVFHGYATGFQDLATFFGNLASAWRGWDGDRSWESVDGDLRIEARHVYGHVHLRVTLRAPGAGWGDDGWSANAHVKVDPGEQLSDVAAQVAALAHEAV